METTRSERIKVGAFMLICGVLILSFLGYVLNRFLTKEYDHYYTIFDESVIGLYTEAKVKLNGIDVGKVIGIQIDPEDLGQVIVSFRVEKGTPVKLGTRAGMTHGISLTGEKQIVLSGGRFDEPDVQEWGYVPAEASAFDQIATKAGGMVTHVDSLLINLNTLFSKRNVRYISNSLKNFEQATYNLQNITADMSGPIDNISKAALSMRQVMSDIEQAKVAAKAGEDLDLLKEKLDAIDTRAINENLVATLESVKLLTDRLNYTAYTNQDQVEQAITELNAVLSNLEEFSQKIKNNPSVLIHSESKGRRK